MCGILSPWDLRLVAATPTGLISGIRFRGLASLHPRLHAGASSRLRSVALSAPLLIARTDREAESVSGGERTVVSRPSGEATAPIRMACTDQERRRVRFPPGLANLPIGIEFSSSRCSHEKSQSGDWRSQARTKSAAIESPCSSSTQGGVVRRTMNYGPPFYPSDNRASRKDTASS
jgi:hypothetical protein